jgi:hypothetical protein
MKETFAFYDVSKIINLKMALQSLIDKLLMLKYFFEWDTKRRLLDI